MLAEFLMNSWKNGGENLAQKKGNLKCLNFKIFQFFWVGQEFRL